MGPLDAFNSTWIKARETFGQGTPDDGSQYDGSSRLMQMKAGVEAAAPDHRWQGAAAGAYATANKEHAEVYGKLAELDKQMAAEVGKAANVVISGRQKLDTTRDWVVSAAASVPNNDAGRRMLVPIVNKGLGDVSDIIQKSTNEMADIGGRIRDLNKAYEELTHQKFAPGTGKDLPKEGKGSAEETTDDARARAEQDVQDALAGDQEAATRVHDVLDAMRPGQRIGTEALSAEQGSYVSQLNAQMNGMSTEELLASEQRLGSHKDIIGNSWQLMSNDDIYFPNTETKVDAIDNPGDMVQGGFDKLPQSLQEALAKQNLPIPGLGLETRDYAISNALDAHELSAIAAIVKDGSPDFQSNTDLDRAILAKASSMSDRLYWPELHDPNLSQRWADPVVSDLLSAVSPDHHAIHDAITTGGNHIEGIDSDKFLHNLTHRAWSDDGDAIASALSWTGHEHSEIAADTAEAYGRYIGEKYDDLLNLGPNRDTTLGELNPRLVQGMAEGLKPYIANIAELTGAPNNGFDFLDTAENRQNGSFPIAKGIFSVLSTDEIASNSFNGAALFDAAASQDKWASAFASDGQDTKSFNRYLEDAVTLRGLSDSGIHNAVEQGDLNEQEKVHSEWQQKKSAWDTGFKVASATASMAPGPWALSGPAIDLMGTAMQDSFIGPEPRIDWQPQDLPDMDIAVAQQQVLNALQSKGIDIAGLPMGYYELVDPDDPAKGFRILSYEEMDPATIASREYKDVVGGVFRNVVGDDLGITIESHVPSRYNSVTEDSDPATGDS
ncbi:hypothetical protein M1247_00150 [Mycobacterium sp. 21AC1]|uniref:TPR repeat region-containing protein n=1 Tax=[Mycobacterium] appelbergii TaxID=2939269 RepID=UPI00293937DB|nr:EspA/EspE family type VII secretion system effector [Mycobacterium sp. 21AC1]MDV3123312.1 hypothetical protein [Mycobacterium sp. 21AC1]